MTERSTPGKRCIILLHMLDGRVVSLLYSFSSYKYNILFSLFICYCACAAAAMFRAVKIIYLRHPDKTVANIGLLATSDAEL